MNAIAPHPSSRLLLVASLLVAPAAMFVGANVLQYGLGLDGAATWLDPLFEARAVAWVLTPLILVGPPAAFLLAAWRLLPIRIERDGDAWEVRIRVRTDKWAMVVLGLSLLVGGILAGHLLAENLACIIGVRSSC